MIRKYPDLAVATQKDMGADEEWGWLLKQDRKASPSVIPFPVFRFITPYAADSVCCQPRKLYWEEIPCIIQRKHNKLPYANTAKERASQKLPGGLEPLAARYIIGLKKMAARSKRKKSI